MTSLYEVLKRSKTAPQLAPDMFTALWAKSITAGKTIELSGQVPLSFKANGEPLLDYTISGNMEQSGTPTPDNPIMPQGCGNMTGNLFDKNNVNYFNGYYVSDSNSLREYSNNAMLYVPITVGVTYTISGIKRYDTSVTQRYLLTSVVPANQVQVVRNFAQAQNIPLTFTAGTDENYLVIMICGDSDYAGYGSVAAAINANSEDIMLNSGSTALPYEPYGFEISISSANTTTPVYLGEVETTRRIKKLVLDGTESWSFFEGVNIWQFYIGDVGLGGVAKSSALSNIVPYGATPDDRQYYEYGCYLVTGGSGVAFQMRGAKDTFTDVTAWKTYLQQQYAAGTPVTVWYVLETPETGIVVNEPLMKIGDYADTFSKAQAGVEIPTNNGSTTLDVLTAVKPSNVSIKYRV